MQGSALEGLVTQTVPVLCSYQIPNKAEPVQNQFLELGRPLLNLALTRHPLSILPRRAFIAERGGMILGVRQSLPVWAGES